MENFILILVKIKKLSKHPYVYEAIFKPIITKAFVDSVKINDNRTNIAVQNIAINLIVFIFFHWWKPIFNCSRRKRIYR